jgi:hypothetical protein
LETGASSAVEGEKSPPLSVSREEAVAASVSTSSCFHHAEEGERCRDRKEAIGAPSGRGEARVFERPLSVPGAAAAAAAPAGDEVAAMTAGLGARGSAAEEFEVKARGLAGLAVPPLEVAAAVGRRGEGGVDALFDSS